MSILSWDNGLRMNGSHPHAVSDPKPTPAWIVFSIVILEAIYTLDKVRGKILFSWPLMNGSVDTDHCAVLCICAIGSTLCTWILTVTVYKKDWHQTKHHLSIKVSTGSLVTPTKERRVWWSIRNRHAYSRSLKVKILTPISFIAGLCHHPPLDPSHYAKYTSKTWWQQRPGNKARIPSVHQQWKYWLQLLGLDSRGWHKLIKSLKQ